VVWEWVEVWAAWDLEGEALRIDMETITAESHHHHTKVPGTSLA
jgi:hypothetical protein